MALPATDSFTDTDGTALDSHSANWTIVAANPQIQSNRVTVSNSEGGEGSILAFWNADTFANDQYAQMYVFFSGNWRAMGPAVRCSSDNGYVFSTSANLGGCVLLKRVSGTVTVLSTVNPPASGTLLRIEASGTTLTCYFDGSTTGAPAATTDSSLASGSGGLGGRWWFGDAAGDDWESGILSINTPQAVAGAMTNTGALLRTTVKAVAGAWSGTGVVARATAKALAGAWSGAGAIARAIGKVVAGAWTGSGAVVQTSGEPGYITSSVEAMYYIVHSVSGDEGP
jgi:hypothetical protein